MTKKKSKRYLSFLLAFLMVTSSLSLPVMAAEDPLPLQIVEPVAEAPLDVTVEVPTVNVGPGVVALGTSLTFSSVTEGASIEYNTVAADSATWTPGNQVVVSAATTYYVRALKAGATTSAVATFAYTLSDQPSTVAQAKAVALDTLNVKVKGIVTYISGKNVYIQDQTGAINLYLKANAAKVKVGDQVIAVGKRANFSNLLQLSNVDEATLIIESSNNALPNAGEFTIEDIKRQPANKTAGYDHMCEILNVKGVKLTSSILMSQSGQSIAIYPAIDFTKFANFVEGDVVNASVRVTDNKGTLQVTLISMEKDPSDLVLRLAAESDTSKLGPASIFKLRYNDALAKVYYTLDGSEPTDKSSLYSNGITLSGNFGDVITVKAIAIAEGKANSDVFSVSITLKDLNAPLTIKDVLALPTDTKEVNVVGTLSYFAQSFNNPVIQSVISGKTYSLYIYGAAPQGAKIGDVIKLKGTFKIYNGLPEMDTITSSSIVSSGTPIPAEEVTLATLKTSGLTMLGRFVKIKDATLGTYAASSTTPITVGPDTMNIYKAAAYPAQVVAGDKVDVYAMVACNNSTVQLFTGTKEANGFNVYDVVNDTKNPLLTLKDAYLPARPEQAYTIAVNAEDNKGLQSVKVTYKIGANTVSDQMMTFDGTSLDYKFIIPADQVLKTAKSIDFTVTATDVTGLTSKSNSKAIAIDDTPQIIQVLPARNGSTGANKSPLITIKTANQGSNATASILITSGKTVVVNTSAMTTLDNGLNFSYQAQELTDGVYNITATVTREDGQKGTATWSFTVGTPKFKAYFGQLHAHTAQYSDGSGTLADGLNYLANIDASDNVDFVSFTDHSNYFDSTAAANPAEAMNDKTKMTPASLALWEQYVNSMADFNAQHLGERLAMPGFEMTWSGGPGHINTFNSQGLVSRNNTSLNNKTADSGMKAYYETLIQNPDPLANLSQFNHPGSTFGTFADFAYWSPAYDNKMVAVEVGNGEGAIGSGGYFASYAEYTKALDKGWHVAPTNNQDNHKGRWGNANTGRSVIITDDLSTNGLLKGLKNMSVYATEDKNLSINYTVNDMMMGSIIGQVPQTPLQFNINVSDADNNDTISKVEVITNSGKIAQSKTFTSNAADWQFEMPPIQGYYYVRVTQADKNLAVSAPIWIGQSPLAGVSSVATDTKLPVTNEVVSLNTTLFNNELNSVTFKSIQYAIGNTVLYSESPNSALATTTTLKHTYNYTPTAPGEVIVSVTVVLAINGVDKSFTQDLALNVRDSSKLVYVGIDASHNNEYVAGNYKDSMGNFANLAVGFDVRVVELRTSEELVAATKNDKYAMLILTPPTRRNGNNFLLNYKSYSDDEIDAIKTFVNKGKTLVISGWGDFYEAYTKFSDNTPHVLPADQHMAAQQNRILQAIGATLRVSDDEIKDDTKNGGSAQRLYLNEYNLSNVYLRDVKPSEQVFSSYGGATIHIVNKEGQPTSELSSSVSPMVYAFSSSYSSDDDKTGTTAVGGTNVPKYNNKYMIAASEQIKVQGGKTANVIVAGAAFMSNFEIQVAMDSYATPAYSNYTILENIVKSVNPPLITDIATLQKAEEGQSFTIQGLVTSNASGFDKNTAFFDCIYLQDATGGINAFPVSGDIRAGQYVEIKGKTSSYNGERQIAVEKVSVINREVQPLPAPVSISVKDAAAAARLGSLVRVRGAITKIVEVNNVVESIFISDGLGNIARIFIDGYITKDKSIAYLEVGNTVTAVGLSSIDTEGARIRIRDRADVVCKVIKDPSEEATPQNPVETKPVIKPAPLPTPDPNQTHPKENQEVKVSTDIKANKDEKGKTQASVSAKDMNTLVDQLNKEDKAGKTPVVEFKIQSAQDKESQKSVSCEIDKEAFKALSNQEQAQVKLTTGIGSLQIDKAALDKIQSEAGIGSGSGISSENVVLSIAKLEVSELSDAVKTAVGDRPVYDFTVEVGSKKVSDFGTGSIQISLPYTLKEGENANGIIVYYVDDEGNLQSMKGNYNVNSGMVEFTTSHFSSYMIAYNLVTFQDVKSSDWYYNAISFIGSRKIASGTGDQQFNPNKAMTRADFLVMLMNAYGIVPESTSTSTYKTSAVDNFADAGNTYYTSYLAKAKKMGIVSGVGNNKFAPGATISRQDTFTMLYKALMASGDLPTNIGTKSLTEFNDYKQIAGYANEAISYFVRGGYISGSQGYLDPNGLATRAELSQLLYNLLLMQ